MAPVQLQNYTAWSIHFNVFLTPQLIILFFPFLVNSLLSLLITPSIIVFKQRF